MKTLLAVLLFCVATGAFACPKGEHIHGGYGSHHKGGICY
jgi:hypothetical protein